MGGGESRHSSSGRRAGRQHSRGCSVSNERWDQPPAARARWSEKVTFVGSSDASTHPAVSEVDRSTPHTAVAAESG